MFLLEIENIGNKTIIWFKKLLFIIILLKCINIGAKNKKKIIIIVKNGLSYIEDNHIVIAITDIITKYSINNPSKNTCKFVRLKNE